MTVVAANGVPVLLKLIVTGPSAKAGDGTVLVCAKPTMVKRKNKNIIFFIFE
jgi:hypothetical protein